MLYISDIGHCEEIVGHNESIDLPRAGSPDFAAAAEIAHLVDELSQEAHIDPERIGKLMGVRVVHESEQASNAA